MTAPLWKVKPTRDPKRLAFCRSLPCALCSATEGIHAHHESERGHGAMGGKTDDSRTIPLCWRHHRLRHDQGREVYGGRDVEALIERINRAYRMTQK